MKAQKLSKHGTSAAICAVWPSKALMPEKIVQDSGFHGQCGGRQVIHSDRDKRGQDTQLNADTDKAHK
jgi:hypothetical protein